jgi:hypothetical protein
LQASFGDDRTGLLLHPGEGECSEQRHVDRFLAVLVVDSSRSIPASFAAGIAADRCARVAVPYSAREHHLPNAVGTREHSALTLLEDARVHYRDVAWPLSPQLMSASPLRWK